MRIAIIDRADMDAEQARVYDAAMDSGGVVGGPYYAYIRLPKLFETSQNLRTCQFSGPLSLREREITTLVVARHWNAQYPWCAHVRIALAAGLEQAIVKAINAGETPDIADPRELTCFVVSHELLAKKNLSEASYAVAKKTLGLEHLIALVALVGGFSMSCLTANAFEVDPPLDAPIPLAQ